jgi:hypothetical protein
MPQGPRKTRGLQPPKLPQAALEALYQGMSSLMPQGPRKTRGLQPPKLPQAALEALYQGMTSVMPIRPDKILGALAPERQIKLALVILSESAATDGVESLRYGPGTLLTLRRSEVIEVEREPAFASRGFQPCTNIRAPSKTSAVADILGGIARTGNTRRAPPVPRLWGTGAQLSWGLQEVLCQGTTSVVPQDANKTGGFSPVGQRRERGPSRPLKSAPKNRALQARMPPPPGARTLRARAKDLSSPSAQNNCACRC